MVSMNPFILSKHGCFKTKLAVTHSAEAPSPFELEFLNSYHLPCYMIHLIFYPMKNVSFLMFFVPLEVR